MGKQRNININNALDNGSVNKDIDEINGFTGSMSPISNGTGKGVVDIDTKGKKGKKKEKEQPINPPVPYFSLFRLASTSDKFLVATGSISAFIGGLCTPLMVILFGNITEAFVGSLPSYCNHTQGEGSSSIKPDLTLDERNDILLDQLGEFSMYMGLLGAATLILIYSFVTAFNMVAENQVHRLRQKYLESLLRQNIGWYDTNEDRNFVSRIAEDLMKIQEATGEKVGLCIYFMSVCAFSLGNAFYHGWKLTLVVLSSAPVLAIAAGVVATVQSKLTSDEQGSYAKAGKVAEEAITNIRTVMAFSGQEKEIERYAEGLALAKIAGKKRGIISGIGVGLMWMIIYASYGLAFWYGTKLILEGRDDVCAGREPDYASDKMLIVFFSVLMGAFNVGQAASYFEAFASGRGAASGIFKVLDREPEIDSYSNKGKKPMGRASGKINFDRINFSYPSRPDVRILKGFSLSIEPGQTVALVGHSGCGKSTCLQLLQRFYDPLSGKISLDGSDIRDLNLGWLRSQIGVVSQEPVLFNTTIAENIRYGREGVTQTEIEEAAKQSNAHLFISKLPNGYETQVGDRGAQLSGGQKQRVAIARALVRNPAILLLDEATSALDTQSESIVQAALDRARLGRTTLIVAHRLTTIRAADLVVSIDKGQVEEKGTHSKLLEGKGLYYQLVTAQMGDRDELEELEEDIEKVGTAIDPLPLRGRRSIPTEDEEILPYIPPILEDSLDEKELAKEAPILRLLQLNQPEWVYITIGTVMAIILGGIVPFYAIIFGEFLGILGDPDPAYVEEKANYYALFFCGIGLLAGISQFLQMFAFTFSGESLTLRVRKLTFAAILRQEPGWFDDSGRSIGSLCARLSGDAASINGATGGRIGSVVQALSTVCFAIALSMYYLPKLAAVAMSFGFVVVFSTYFEGKLMTGQNISEKKGLEEVSKVAVESVSNIRTVASLGKEKSFVQVYRAGLEKPHRYNLKMAHLRGFIFGIAQSMPLFAYAVVMWYGGYLIVNESDPDHPDNMYKNVFKVAESLIFGTMMIGQALAFAPNYNKAKVSGARILRLLDRKPLIDNSGGVGILIKNAEGRVDFENVEFSYPTRPSAKILKCLTLIVQPGKKVAIVGPSGSGKSTCIQLILRFYDPRNGTVQLDQTDVASLNVESLRSQLAIVAQEPALFDRTLRENIAYGDNSRQISVEEVIKAARMANIHTFISSLPTGYETRVGEMGTQLSGGQKQRVAIARALVRNPKVLLLDEATSALDMESEQVVQEALEIASDGRTSITIAHRLSSIQNADCIMVINNGELAESGTHGELLQQRGIYHRLWNMQGGQSSDKS